MPNIYDIADQFRAALLRYDAAALADLIQAYGHVYQRIQVQLDALTAQIQAARDAGQGVNLSWLFQQERLQTLQRQVEEEMAGFAVHADGTVTATQQQAVDAAQQHARQLTLAGLGEPPPGVTMTWANLPTSATRNLVGFASNGSPLRKLLDELGPDASKAIRDALIDGVALGQNPRVIARRIRGDLGGNLVRAMTISRTEVLRSYRSAALQSYKANSDVVSGWVWNCSKSARTCPACLALDGTFHTLDEEFASHPRCRCQPLPQTKTWAELGFPGVQSPTPTRQTGQEWFEKQPDSTQQRILGKGAFAAYQAGTVTLKDFIGTKHSEEWGSMHYARSLREILGEKEARAWIRKALAA